MYRKLLFFSFIIVGVFAAFAAYAADCPKIYQGINCGDNYYCGGCVASCPTCPSGKVLNYVSCTCQCSSGTIDCGGTCMAPPTCSTSEHRKTTGACSPNECGDCEVGYSPDPTPGHESAPNPCVKNALMDYANSGDFKLTGATSGDLYMANTRAIRVDGTGTTALNIGNWGTGVSVDLTLFGGLVVGSPLHGSQGAGTINAEKLCIQGSCREDWPAAVSAFVNGGNVGFGPPTGVALLGTNDNIPLAFKTNNTTRMYVDTTGNVGIGTTNPTAALQVINPVDETMTIDAENTSTATGGSSAVSGSASGTTNYNYGVIGRAEGTTGSAGVYGISGNSSTTQTYGVYGSANGANSSAGVYGVGQNSGTVTNYGGYFYTNGTGTGASGVLGEVTTAASNIYGVQGRATSNAAVQNYGGYFKAAGQTGMGVYGEATNTVSGPNFGGYFVAKGTNGIGVYGIGDGTSGVGVYGYADSYSGANYGGLFQSNGVSGYGIYATVGGSTGTAVYGLASNTIAVNYGGYFEARGPSSYGVRGKVTQGSSWSGYFTGGYGLYADKVCLGGETNCRSDWPAGGSTPGGSNTQVQFNNSGSFGGDSGLTYNASADALTVGGLLSAGSLNVSGSGTIGGLTSSGGATGVYGSGSSYGIEGVSGYIGVYGSGTTYGIYGDSSGQYGVYGHGGTYGVRAEGGTYGVYGSGINYGVYGYSVSGWAGYFSGGQGVYVSQLCISGDCKTSWPTGIGGSGTANYLPKFTGGTTTIGNSQIYDNGTNVGVGTAAPGYKLDINGTVHAAGSTYGVYGSATSYGVYGSGAYGVYGSGSSMGGYFYNSSSPYTYGYIGYGAYGGYFGGNVFVSGNTGLGVSSPAYKLDVSGDINLTGNLRATGNTPDTCGWESVPSNTINYTCSSGKFMTGIHKNSSSVVDSIQCCEL